MIETNNLRISQEFPQTIPALQKSPSKFNSRKYQNFKNSLKLQLFSQKGNGNQLFQLNETISTTDSFTSPEIITDISFEIKEITNIENYYSLGEVLGEGGSAIVKRATQVSTNKQVAVKIVKLKDDEQLFNMKYEFKHMLSLPPSDLIVQVYEMLIDTKIGKIYTIMELVEGAEMFEILANVGSYNEQQARQLFRQILSAIRFLHSNGVCHRDLKPNNILVCGDGRVKITDFNVSKFSESVTKFQPWKKNKIKMMTYTGTYAFKAPEMYLDGEYTEMVDMWSAGVMLYTMLSGNQPFNGEYLDDLIEAIKEAKVKFDEDSWLGISKEAQDLVIRLLEKNPENRIDSELALIHPWINNQQISEKELPKSIVQLLSKNKKKFVKNAQNLVQSSYIPESNFVFSFLNFADSPQKQVSLEQLPDFNQLNMIGKLKLTTYESEDLGNNNFQACPQQIKQVRSEEFAFTELNPFGLQKQISKNYQLNFQQEKQEISEVSEQEKLEEQIN